jgi:hypothetical protein
MDFALTLPAIVLGVIGLGCVVRPLEALAFCRWYHSKKPRWVQDLPYADLVVRPWMPTYFRAMGVVFCAFALLLVWLNG